MTPDQLTPIKIQPAPDGFRHRTMKATSRITLSPRRTQNFPHKLYTGLALLTDSAKRVTQEIQNPIATKINIQFLALAIENAETILIKYPTTQ
jgi:hypothetical protein